MARPPGGPPITARIAEDTLHEEPERLDSVTKPEVAKLQDYLRRKFANASIRIVALKNGDSAEVYIGEEFIGVLFLDELPEFPRQAIEALRQPLESGRTTVSRAAAHVTYPARFQLITAMNPCRCGHLGDAARECNKAPRCGEDYLGRISGPLLDRMDIVVHVQPVPPAELSRAPLGERSAAIALRVAAARQPGLRIMFITGFAAVALTAAQASPQAKVLSKPVHLRDLVHEVERMVAA